MSSRQVSPWGRRREAPHRGYQEARDTTTAFRVSSNVGSGKDGIICSVAYSRQNLHGIIIGPVTHSVLACPSMMCMHPREPIPVTCAGQPSSLPAGPWCLKKGLITLMCSGDGGDDQGTGADESNQTVTCLCANPVGR